MRRPADCGAHPSSERLGAAFPAPNPRPEPESTCPSTRCIPGSRSRSCSANRSWTKSQTAQQLETQSTDRPQPLFYQSGWGWGYEAVRSVFAISFLPLVQKTCVYQSGYRPGPADVPESSGCAADPGPARSERGGARALPARLHEWMCHGTKRPRTCPSPAPALARAPPLTCPRAPHLQCTRTAPHLPLAP